MKNKNLNHLCVVSFLFLLLFFNNSCKKELLVSEASHKLTIADVKQWYMSKHNNSFHNDTTHYKTMGYGGSNGFSLLWQLATENLSQSKQDVVAIPLNKGTNLSFGNYGFRKLLVYRNDQGGLEGEVMEVIFDDKDVKERKYQELYEMSKFNGKVILYDMEMHFKTGYTYKNGKPDRIINLDLSNHSTDTLAKRPNSKKTSTVSTSSYPVIRNI